MFLLSHKSLITRWIVKKACVVTQWILGQWQGNGEKVILVGLLHLSVRADYEEKNQKADVTSGSLELVLQQSWSLGWHLSFLTEKKTRRDLQSCGFLANKIIKNTLSLWDMLPGRVPDGTSIGYQKKIWTIEIHTFYTPKSSNYRHTRNLPNTTKSTRDSKTHLITWAIIGSTW